MKFTRRDFNRLMALGVGAQFVPKLYAQAEAAKVRYCIVGLGRISMQHFMPAIKNSGKLSRVIALVSGNKVYSKLKYESGVHRVQRVPVTEQQGRVHTSAITVAVLPEADEVEVKIEAKDIRIDTFCSSGPGGQRQRKSRKKISRTAPRPNACCVRVSMSWNWPSSRRCWARNAAPRWAPATAAKKSAPTTSRKTASRITASA